MINVTSHRNGVSYDQRIKVDGFPQTVLRYMPETERDAAPKQASGNGAVHAV